MPVHFTHINIIARDWRGLAGFYEKVFECVPVPPNRNLSGEWLAKGTGIKDVTLQGIHLRLPGYDKTGLTLEIFSYNQMIDNCITAPNRIGIAHLAFSVDDVQKTLELVIKNGGRAWGEVVQRHIYGVGLLTIVFAADPEGNILEIQNLTRD